MNDQSNAAKQAESLTPCFKFVPESEEQWLLIDCDDVMGDFATYICEAMNKVGKQAKKDDYKEYRFGEYHDLNHEQFTKCIADSDAFLNLTPFEGVKEALTIIKAKGYKIAIVTARGMFEDAYINTAEWLKKHDLDYDRLYVVHPKIDTKSEIAYQLGIDKVAGLVDDAEHNLVDAINNNINAIRIEQPWNTDSNYDFSAKSLLEVAHLL